MIRVMPRVNSSSAYHHSPGPTKYLSVYLSLKILSGFCQVPPLNPQRIQKIAQENSLSSLIQGQEGLGPSIARQFLLPFLDKQLPKLLESKLHQIREAIDTPLAFPEDFFHTTLEQLNRYYSDVIRVYREIGSDPYLSDTIDASIAQRLESLYVQEHGDEIHYILEAIFKKSLERIPWIFRAPISLFLYFIGFILRYTVSFPSFSAPNDLPALDACLRITICRFLKEFKNALKKEPSCDLSIRRKLFEQYLQNQFLVTRLSGCTSQVQIQQVLNDSSILRWVEDKFIYSEISKETEKMLSIVWSIIETPSWRKKEMEHFLYNFRNLFENPSAILEQPHDVDAAMQELIEEILEQKLPSSLSALKGPGAHMAMVGKKIAFEKWTDFWLKPYSLRFGILHRQFLMRYL